MSDGERERQLEEEEERPPTPLLFRTPRRKRLRVVSLRKPSCCERVEVWWIVTRILMARCLWCSLETSKTAIRKIVSWFEENENSDDEKHEKEPGATETPAELGLKEE